MVLDVWQKSIFKDVCAVLILSDLDEIGEVIKNI